jgi:hypothetical protein
MIFINGRSLLPTGRWALYWCCLSWLGIVSTAKGVVSCTIITWLEVLLAFTSFIFLLCIISEGCLLENVTSCRTGYFLPVRITNVYTMCAPKLYLL